MMGCASWPPKSCRHCGAPMTPKPWEGRASWAARKFCSRPCFGASARLDINDILQRHTIVAASGCHEWTGYLDPKGYGRTGDHDGEVLVHRISWILRHGPIGGNLHVLHRCDNRKCRNVEHLFLGTNDDNVADCAKKGRHAKLKGVENGNAVLIESDVLAIRSDTRRQIDIAADYGVSQSLVSMIKLRQAWGHLGTDALTPHAEKERAA